MYNKIILQGNVTRDIEIHYTQGGSAIGKTGIAVNRKFKAATGEQKEEVMFVDLTFFGRTAEIANQYLRKGSQVLVDGRLTLDQWTAQDGTKRSKHSVTVENLQMLGSKDGSSPTGNSTDQGIPVETYGADGTMEASSHYQAQPTNNAPSQYAANQPSSNIPEIDINEDEIPF